MAFENTLDIFGDGSCTSLWTFNTDASDENSVWNGVEVNGASHPSGRFDEAYRSDKTLEQYVLFSGFGSWLATQQVFTLSFHVRPYTTADLAGTGGNLADSLQFSWFNGSTRSKITLRMTETAFFMEFDYNKQIYITGQNYNSSKYYNIVLSKNGTGANIYLDTENIWSGGVTSLWNNISHTNVAIGTITNIIIPSTISSVYFDQMRLFNKAVDDAGELLRLKNEGDVAIANLTGSATIFPNTAIRSNLTGTASVFGDPQRPPISALTATATMNQEIVPTVKSGFELLQEIKAYSAERSFLFRQKIEVDPTPTTLIKRI